MIVRKDVKIFFLIPCVYRKRCLSSRGQSQERRTLRR